MKLIDIAKGREYNFNLFSETKIEELESLIVMKEGKWIFLSPFPINDVVQLNIKNRVSN